MSILFDVNTEFLSRTANLPTGACTVTGWAYMTTDLNTFTPLFFISDATGTDATRYVQIGTGADGTSFVGEIHVNTSTGGGWSDTGVVINVATDAWYFFALSWDTVTGGVTLRMYARAATATALSSGSVGATWSGTFVPASFRVARDVATGIYNGRFNGRVAGMKMWDAELSSAEILAESFQLMPVRWTNYRNIYPLWNESAAGVADYGANGHNWTVNGSPTPAESPPVPLRIGRRKSYPATVSSPPPSSTATAWLLTG